MKKLFFIFFLVTGTAVAQKKKSYTVYINYPDYTLRAEVLSEPLQKRAKKNLDYFWYYSNKIIQTQGGYDGRLLNGAYTSFFLSGNLKEKGIYANGLKHGEWTSWYDNGAIYEIITWKKGTREGLYQRFDEKGKPLEVAAFKRGSLHGTQQLYENNKLLEKKFRRGKEILPRVKTEKSKLEKNSATEKEGFFKKLFKKKKVKGENATTQHKKENKTAFFSQIFRKKENRIKNSDQKTKKPARKNDGK